MIDAKELIVFGVVYKISNIINGEVYIGATTKNLITRWREHKHNSIHLKKKCRINKAMFELGVDNFEIKVIKTCFNENQLYASEKFFIKQYNSIDPEFGYNDSIGGKMSSLGKKLSLDTKTKISEYQKIRKRKPHSENTKIKMRNAARGRNMDKAVLASVLSRKQKLIK